MRHAYRLRSTAVLFAAFAAAAPAAEPDVAFLEGEAARQAFVDAARDSYFARLQPLEMAAKTGRAVAGVLDAQRIETRRRYREAVRSFTSEEQAALRAYVAGFAPLLAAYPRFARQPWRFVKVGNTIEGGLPHTRGDIIVLPEEVSAGLVALRKQLPPDASLARAGMLLVHEQLHVLQRREPARFDSLYTKVFGFVRVAPFALTTDLVANQVVNPDGSACCWLFPLRRGGYVLPYLAFAEHDGLRRMPEDFRMLAVRVVVDGRGHRVEHDEDGRAETDELLQVPEYVAAFPLTRNFYDPNEAAADLFAQLVVYDGLMRARLAANQQATLERDLAPLRGWFRANLGEPVARRASP